MSPAKAETASEMTSAAERIANDAAGIKPSVHEALTSVMEAVQAVGKTGRNTSQNYNFRGIDAVVNAVGPAFRAHGVVCCPRALSVQFESYKATSGTHMRSCVVHVCFRFYGPAGDFVEATVYGEASDSGDKAVPKAHSVAFRTALLQVLTIPTDEPDPDTQSHERAAPEQVVLLPEGWRSETERKTAWDELLAAKKALTDPDTLAEVDAWVDKHGLKYGTFTAAMADELRNLLPAEPAPSLSSEKGKE